MKKTVLILGIIFLLVCISVSPIVGSISKVNQSINQKLPNTSLVINSSISLITVKVAGEMGLNDWYVSDVGFNFTYESDDISLIEYQVNQGALQNYTEPFLITEDGEDICLEWCAVDNNGNQSEIDGPFVFNIDQTRPFSDMVYEWRDGPGPGTWWMTVTVNATDEMSGMNRVEFYVNDEHQETIEGPGPEYIWEFLYIGGYELSVTYEAYDNAGNMDTTIYTPPGNIDILERTKFFKNLNIESIAQKSSANFLPSEVKNIDNNRVIKKLPTYINPIGEGFAPTYNIIVFNRTIMKNGWLADNASIYFQYDFDGISEVYFKINDEDWILYTAPLIISDDGIYVFSWYVIDSEGHSSSLEHISFKKDQTPPKVNLKVDKLSINEYKLTADASDETSGIKIIKFICKHSKIRETEIKDFEFPYECTIATFRVLYFEAIGIDNAGNSYSNRIYHNFNYDYIIRPIHPFLLRFLDHFPLLHRLLDVWRCNLI